MPSLTRPLHADSRKSVVDSWLEQTIPKGMISLEGSSILPTTELPDDGMSLRDDASTSASSMIIPGSTSTGTSERLITSSPLFRSTLKMNGVHIDNFGTKTPKDIEELVTKHIRRKRDSPRLGSEERDEITSKIADSWDKPEPMVSDISSCLFPVDLKKVSQGGDTLWSTQPLPRNPEYPHGLVTPKTDRHYGFHTALKSSWSPTELAAASHPSVRPYSQPTNDNLFSLFLLEVKSEATGGTLYAAESQLAGSGAHRVQSMR
ncbi:hypothetical protein BU24DRAFT_425194 [Aaosphaeria arxii CBS 175.79]|uniref:Uncharacterized protein n=1 Tax=Aaosphaeria arxii CBS 175.79 TaxID=1450172 RepID=A0A6A5XIE2_9PLEO|nr:uncharacterized protein BU24DRAFT_425194 [Aaosphaeria arxii CBS 175.79]KAF2012550.1 hypothetical protein BU24DRAFT_425194 [Aaosphaeria arxii CBS 175.79]